MIYLRTHLQTEDDYEKKRSYQKNVSLNDTGRREGKRLHDKWKDFSFDYCFTSPLIRDVESAMILVGEKVIIDRDDRLIEGKEGENVEKRLSSFLDDLKRIGVTSTILCISDVFLLKELEKLLQQEQIDYQWL